MSPMPSPRRGGARVMRSVGVPETVMNKMEAALAARNDIIAAKDSMIRILGERISQAENQILVLHTVIRDLRHEIRRLRTNRS